MSNVITILVQIIKSHVYVSVPIFIISALNTFLIMFIYKSF